MIDFRIQQANKISRGSQIFTFEIEKSSENNLQLFSESQVSVSFKHFRFGKSNIHADPLA